jgi:hypothetical protein
MQGVLAPVLGRCAELYLDDILIWSRTAEEHEMHLTEVLTLLRKHNLYANAKKCSLFVPEVKYLGHIISADGISVDPSKTTKLREWPVPTSVKELQAFLGLCNYFRRFIPHFSELAKPLTDLTAKGRWRIPLTQQETDAFNALKRALIAPPVLAMPQFDKPFDVFCDASDSACGALLVQAGRPVAYMSKKFNSAERNYPTHDRECLGIVSAYREWRCYLEGVPSTCYTDHKPLTQLQSQPQISRRQARWLEFLASFQPNVVYVQGKYNPADVLSRPPHQLPPTLPDVGQGTSEHPSFGSSALLLTETASGPTRTRCVNLPAAREGCSTHPVRFPSCNPSQFPTCTIGTVDALEASGSRPSSHSDEVRLATNSAVTQTCHPTRMVPSVTAILLNAVNPVTYHPVLPMLTGAQAREWWVAAYQADHLFRDPKLINRYQLTKRDDFWYYNVLSGIIS